MKKVVNLIKYFFIGVYTIIICPFKYLIIGIMYVFMPRKRKELQYKGKPLVPLMMITLSLSIYFISIFFISRWYVQNLKIDYLTKTIIDNTKVIEQIEKEEKNNKPNNNITTTPYIPSDQNNTNESFISVDFTSLLEQNKDTVGWIRVNNTNIDYSIVQTTDNEYYLSHDFNKRYNIYGWVFGDFRDDFTKFQKNTIIYAHNTGRGTMFATLPNATKEYWYTNEENHYIKISTPTSNTIWKIFSIYTTTGDDVYYLKTYFNNKDDYQDFLNTLKDKSIYNFNETLTSNDKILTLSTCDSSGKRRIAVHAKMIKVEYR